MAEPRMLRRLKTRVFWQEIRFISIISIQKQMQRDQFPTKNEGYGGRAINYFYQKRRVLATRIFLQKMKGAAPLRAIFFFQKMKGAYRADFHSKTEGALVTRYSIFFFPLLLLLLLSPLPFSSFSSSSTSFSSSSASSSSFSSSVWPRGGPYCGPLQPQQMT